MTSDNGEFANFGETQMILMLQELTSHSNMRFDSDGNPVSESQRGIFERSFRDHFNLSAEQWACLTDIHDRCALGDIASARADSSPTPVAGGRPAYVRRVFASERTRCCGRLLRVRWVSASVYTRDDCYAAWNLVKSCRRCRTRYMFDKKVLSGLYGGRHADWHVYNAWVDGRVPAFVATKSGHGIFCTRYLTAVLVDQRTMG